ISRSARSGVRWVSLPPGLVASGAGPQVRSRSKLRAATAPLAVHPSGHISIPDMASVPDRAKRRQDEVPASLILQRSPRSQRDERAPFVASNTPIYGADELLIEVDLNPHKTSVSELWPGLLLQPAAAQRAAVVRAIRGVTRSPQHHEHADSAQHHRREHERDLSIRGEKIEKRRSHCLPQQSDRPLRYRVRLRAYARVSAFSTSASAVFPSIGYEETPHERAGIL